MIFISRSEEETEKLGYEFAKNLKLEKFPMVIKLYGGLGSGKTTFTRGFLKFFNIKNVRSPSFTIINEYTFKDIKIYHMDFYRLENVEIEKLGIDEIINKKAILIIEWPEKLNFEFENFIDIHFEILSETERRISFKIS
ncbi:MAG: tRNA (adenosine(37)-N6)-threonylcarbamoyltransferase complex ATPase subunit type 1 TsaE [candidate division WOR-3 bacterium]|jgi:tRNA threonylcarbamoyladenosine biosynthesis protein TsaE